MQKRRHEIDIHKDMLRAQIKSSEEERQTVRYSSGGRTGEETWQPVLLVGYSGVWGKAFLSDVRQLEVNRSCEGFWYANVSLVHFEVTEIGSSAPIRTRCPIWKRHSLLLPKGAWVVHALTHPRERIKHLCLSSLFTRFYDLSYERSPGERSYISENLGQKSIVGAWKVAENGVNVY